MSEYISPIDGHLHYSDTGRANCAVCCLEAERDLLRDDAVPKAAEIMNGLSARVRELEAERDRLRTDAAEAVSERKGLRVALTAANEEADAMRAERDRLRAVVDATLVWLRQMTDLACAVDVLHVADLYRTVTGQLDATPTGEDT